MSGLDVADSATPIDFEIHQGETFKMDFEVVDKNGAPVPTAGFLVRAVARRELDDPRDPPYVTWDSSNGSAQAAAGSSTSVRLISTAATTTQFLWRSAVYDIKVTDLSGNVGYIAKGTVTVIPQSTS